jgi:hypothetical protein
MMPATRRVGVEAFSSGGDAIRSDFKKTSEEIRNVGAAAEETNTRASAAMNGVASSSRAAAAAFGVTGAAAGEMRQKITENKAAMAGLDTQIAGLKGQLAALDTGMAKAMALQEEDKQALRELAGDAALLRAEMKELQAQKASLGAENKVLQSTLGNTSEKSLSAAGALRLMGMESKLTGESMGFAVRPAAALLGAFSAFNPMVLIVTLGIGFLIEKMVSLFKHGSENVQITKAMIENDVLLAGIFARLAAAGGDVDGSIARQSEAYKKLLQSDISSLLTTYVSQYREYDQQVRVVNSDNEEARRIQGVLNNQQRDGVSVNQQQVNAIFNTAEMQKKFASSTAEARDELGKHEAKLKSTEDALMAAYRAGVINERQLYAEAKAAGADGNALAYLRGQIEATANAQEQLNAAVKNFRPAALDTKAQEAIVEQMRVGIISARSQGASIAQLAPRVDELRQASAKLAAAQATETRTTLDKNQAHERTRQVMEGSYLSLGGIIEQTKTYEKNLDSASASLDKHTGAHNKGAAAARSYSNTLIDLRKRAEEEWAALSGDTFDQQEAKMRAADDALRAHLAVNNKDREAALAEIDSLERAQIAGINQKRLEAEHNVTNTIRQLRISSIQDESERRLAEIEFEVDRFAEARRKEFSDANLVYLMIDIYRRHLLDGFNKWESDQNAKHWQHQRAVREEEERKFWEHAKKIEFEARSNRAGRAATQDDTEAQVQRLRKIFGSAETGTRSFQLQMKAVEAMSNGHILSGLIAEFKAFTATMIESGQFADIWANAMVQTFDLVFNEGANFLETFGKMLLAGLLKAYGQMAIASGQYHVAEGIARMATIWDFAGGLKEFAAGTALLALGAAMVGAAGAISNSAHHSAAAGGGAASAAAGGGSAAQAGGQAQRPPHQPTVINLSTAQPPVTVEVTYDATAFRSLFTKAMIKEGFIHEKTAAKRHKRTLRRVTREEF